MAYVSISVEGGLYPADLLERIATGDSTLTGQKSADFGIDGTRRLTDEIQSAFSDGRSYWDAFQRRLGRSSESRTTITREDWMRGFLELMGFNKLVLQRSSVEVGNEKFFISHRADDYSDATPIHIVSIEQELDHRESTGRRSPHGLVQDYLNRSNALWGIVTNGKKFRLLRNIARLSKPTYLEFNLEGMMVGNLYSEFVLLYRLLHASRFPKEDTNVHECLLERYYQQGIEEGDRVREKLRDGVEDALRILGTAFLVHPKSEELRRKFQSGALTAPAYYRQLLRLVYRLLFLMVAEERKLIFPQSADIEQSTVYMRYYSLTRLRERADRYFAGDQNIDLWLGISQTFYMLRDNDKAKLLGLSALNGELFSITSCTELEGATCTNDALLKAVRELSTFRNDNGTRRRVNYAGLDVEEFGSVYESLLDFQPQVTLQPPAFDLIAGSERKQTGSYYTPPELVHELIESALVPVIQERLRTLKTREERETTLLNLRVCDPASGSGHFLLAAARRIARELATIRSDGHEPSPQEYRHALRDVIRNCVYAVDKNPLAVDLCKVALWIEGHNAGLPLSFLDNHIKCGDSLVGVTDLKVLSEGIPDDAYQPVTGDDKKAATYYKKRNQAEKQRERQLAMGQATPLAEVSQTLAQDFQALATLEEQTPDDVHTKEDLYNSLRQSNTKWWSYKVACDLWTSAFFLPLQSEDALHMSAVPTTDTVRQHLLTNSALPNLVGRVVDASYSHSFFHWPLEFPDVFTRGGFDVVLGNPPWEQLQPQEIEFFGVYDQTIAKLAGAQRKKAIERLWETNPELALLWEGHIRVIEATTKFIRGSARNRLTAHGKINTYSIFAETARRLIAEKGRMGMIVPSGIATDDATKEFFADLVDQRCLVSLLSFENEALVFPGIHHATKFCLLTISGGGAKTEAADLVFFARRATDLQEERRHFTLRSEDFRLINPNTLTCPIFRNQRDAEVTRGIYQRVPVLINEKTGENPWGLSFRQGLFNMTSDSHMFQTRSGSGLLPLYEAKMIHQFDHRFGTYEGQTEAQANQGKLPELTDEQHAQPSLTILPRYWVTKSNVDMQISDKWDRRWFLGWRDITSAVTARTVVSCIIPRVGVGNSLPIILLSKSLITLSGQLCANLCSFVLDYVARFKVGGTHLNFFIISQLPVLSPNTYERKCPWSGSTRLADWFAPHVLELTYTAWDLQPFAIDHLHYHGSPFRWDPERRFLLRCELDAAFFHLYGMEREDVDYILNTFPLVKERDEKNYGEYRTKRAILEIYDDMAQSMRTGQPYQTRLNPPPADPRVAHNPPGR